MFFILLVLFLMQSQQYNFLEHCIKTKHFVIEIMKAVWLRERVGSEVKKSCVIVLLVETSTKMMC